MAVSVSHSVYRFPLFHRNRPHAPQCPQTPTSKAPRTPLLKYSSFRCISLLNDKTQSTTLKTCKNSKAQYDTLLNDPLAWRFHTANFAGAVTEKEENSNLEARAVGRYIRMSADKARRVVEQIRGRSYEDSLLMLELMPYRACVPILKLVISAAANASNNLGMKKSGLIISKAEVDGGPTMKRMRPQARGRAYPIRKRTCHITIAVKGSPSDLETEKVST